MLKILSICDTEAGEKAYNEWIAANPGIRVTTRHVCPKPPCVILLIFYDTPADDQFLRDHNLKDEKARLAMLKDIAKSLKMDRVYDTLSNATQRRLYLLDVKGIPVSDADIVVELMKPALACLIEGDINAPKRDP